MTGQSTVTGTISAYAGGSIVATFQPQGGGKPAVPTVSSTIAGDGTFSLLAWDNTNAIYAPSQTTFLIAVGPTSYSASTTVAGASEDISSIFGAAPTPPSGAGGVPSVNGITDAVTIKGGGTVTVTDNGDVITVTGLPVNPDQGNATGTGAFTQIVLGTTPTANSVSVWSNGLILNPSTDYTRVARTITLTVPGVLNQVIVASWITAATASGSIALA